MRHTLSKDWKTKQTKQTRNWDGTMIWERDRSFRVTKPYPASESLRRITNITEPESTSQSSWQMSPPPSRVPRPIKTCTNMKTKTRAFDGKTQLQSSPVTLVFASLSRFKAHLKFSPVKLNSCRYIPMAKSHKNRPSTVPISDTLSTSSLDNTIASTTSITLKRKE